MVLMFTSEGESLPLSATAIQDLFKEVLALMVTHKQLYLYRLADSKWFSVNWESTPIQKEITAEELPQIPGRFSI